MPYCDRYFESINLKQCTGAADILLLHSVRSSSKGKCNRSTARFAQIAGPIEEYRSLILFKKNDSNNVCIVIHQLICNIFLRTFPPQIHHKAAFVDLLLIGLDIAFHSLLLHSNQQYYSDTKTTLKKNISYILIKELMISARKSNEQRERTRKQFISITKLSYRHCIAYCVKGTDFYYVLLRIIDNTSFCSFVNNTYAYCHTFGIRSHNAIIFTVIVDFISIAMD